MSDAETSGSNLPHNPVPVAEFISRIEDIMPTKKPTVHYVPRRPLQPDVGGTRTACRRTHEVR